MFGSLSAALERIAEALEKSANTVRNEDAAAREAIRALNARLEGALGDHKARLVALEAGSDGALLKRALAAEARLDALEPAFRSLRAKVYRDPAFHEPKAAKRASADDVLPPPLGSPLAGLPDIGVEEEG